MNINKTSTPSPLPRSHEDNEETKKNQETADQETDTTTADNDIDLHELVDELKKMYESVFNVDTELKTMTGEPMRIELVDNVTIKPLHVNVPRRTPYAYQKIAKAELDRLVELGILEKVSVSSDWISPMSFVPKPDGTVRLTADFVNLNKYVKRRVHPFTVRKTS